MTNARVLASLSIAFLGFTISTSHACTPPACGSPVDCTPPACGVQSKNPEGKKTKKSPKKSSANTPLEKQVIKTLIEDVGGNVSAECRDPMLRPEDVKACLLKQCWGSGDFAKLPAKYKEFCDKQMTEPRPKMNYENDSPDYDGVRDPNNDSLRMMRDASVVEDAIGKPKSLRKLPLQDDEKSDADGPKPSNFGKDSSSKID